jgi:hypothetical protein
MKIFDLIYYLMETSGPTPRPPDLLSSVCQSACESETHGLNMVPEAFGELMGIRNIFESFNAQNGCGGLGIC